MILKLDEFGPDIIVAEVPKTVTRLRWRFGESVGEYCSAKLAG